MRAALERTIPRATSPSVWLSAASAPAASTAAIQRPWRVNCTWPNAKTPR
jgi:hypothetical protein